MLRLLPAQLGPGLWAHPNCWQCREVGAAIPLAAHGKSMCVQRARAPQDLLKLGLWHALRRLSVQVEQGFWAHPHRPEINTPEFPHWRASLWRASLWRPEHSPACGAGSRAGLADGSTAEVWRDSRPALAGFESAQLELAFWAHVQCPELETPEFPHWCALLWRPKAPPACRAGMAGGSAA